MAPAASKSPNGSSIGGAERASVFASLASLLDAHAPAADDVTLIGPRVQGFAVNPYLPLPDYLLDAAAPGR